MYKTIAGIEPVSPGYKQIAINPNPGGGISYARSIKDSMYGKIESDWEITEGQFTLNVEIPANTTATITLPQAADKKITEDGENINHREEIRKIQQSEEKIILDLGSGQYSFTYPIEIGIASKEHPEVLNIDSPLAKLIAQKRTRDLLKKQVPDVVSAEQIKQIQKDLLKQ